MGVKLGQKWAVKDGNLLASNQVGSRFFNKEFDFSRASNGTYVDRDGLLKTAELYNLVDYSEDFTQWSASNISIDSDSYLAPNGTLNATLITPTTSDGYLRELTNSFVSGQSYTASIYLKSNSGSNFDINLRLRESGGGQDLIESKTITTEWQRFDITITATLTSNYQFWIGGSATWRDDEPLLLYGAQVVEGTQRDYQYTNGLQGLPRISFEDGVGHLLLEPQRTNVLLKSNQFDNWGTSGYNITSGQSGIYGTNDAWLIDKQDLSNSYINQGGLGFTGDFTVSVYAKAGSLNKFMFYTDGKYVVYDLQNGTSQATGAVTSHSIDYIDNGWYRCWFTGSNTNVVYIQPKASNGGFASGSIYIQHAQLESGSYPTSIIETTTTSVTRNADVCNNSGSAQDFNSEEGVLYGEILKRQNDNDNFILISINDGSGNDQNSVTIGFDSDNDSYARIKANNTSILISQNLDTNRDEYYKIALKYNSSGDNALWINGSEVLSNTTSFAFANPLNRLDFAYDSDYILPFYGKVKNLQVFTEALSDEELENLTT